MLSRLWLDHCAKNKRGKHQTGLCEGCGEEEFIQQVVVSSSEYDMQR